MCVSCQAELAAVLLKQCVPFFNCSCLQSRSPTRAGRTKGSDTSSGSGLLPDIVGSPAPLTSKSVTSLFSPVNLNATTGSLRAESVMENNNDSGDEISVVTRAQT
jgi:hypothetical protein